MQIPDTLARLLAPGPAQQPQGGNRQQAAPRFEPLADAAVARETAHPRKAVQHNPQPDGRPPPRGSFVDLRV